LLNNLIIDQSLIEVALTKSLHGRRVQAHPVHIMRHIFPLREAKPADRQPTRCPITRDWRKPTGVDPCRYLQMHYKPGGT